MLILHKTQTESALSCSAWPASVCSRWCSWGRWGWRRVRGRSSTPRSRWCTRWCSSCSTSALLAALSWSENTVANINYRTKCICKFLSLHPWSRLYKIFCLDLMISTSTSSEVHAISYSFNLKKLAHIDEAGCCQSWENVIQNRSLDWAAGEKPENKEHYLEGSGKLSSAAAPDFRSCNCQEPLHRYSHHHVDRTTQTEPANEDLNLLIGDCLCSF